MTEFILNSNEHKINDNTLRFDFKNQSDLLIPISV